MSIWNPHPDELDVPIPPPPRQGWFEPRENFVRRHNRWVDNTEHLRFRNSELARVRAERAKELKEQAKRKEHALREEAEKAMEELEAPARQRAECERLLREDAERQHAARLKRLDLLVLEFKDGPMLASDEYAQRLARSDGARLIQQAARIRAEFQAFHSDSEFVAVLRNCAGEDAASLIAYVTREHRALQCAIAFAVEPKSPSGAPTASPSTPTTEKPNVPECIELLG